MKGGERKSEGNYGAERGGEENGGRRGKVRGGEGKVRERKGKK